MDEPHGTAILLLLNLPTSALCGLDLIAFKPSPRFQGVKQIPEGWHFVFFGINEAVSIRRGAWFHVSGTRIDAPPQVLIRHFDPQREDLIVEVDEAVVLRWKADLGKIWRDGLTPYRTSVSQNTSESEEGFSEESHDWDQLTDCINASLLSRITGSTDFSNSCALTSASCAKEDADNIPGLSAKESALHQDTDLGFLPIDLKQTWRAGAVGRERTDAAQDRSWAFRNLVDEHCNEMLDIIGELQFCFIMVLTLNNNSCLEQWKRILGLLLTCKTASIEHATFFARFLRILRLQIEHCQDAEGGLFDLSEDGAPLIKSLLKRFRQGIEQQHVGQAKQDVLDELEDLEDYLKLEYGWVMNEPQVRSGWLQLEDGEQIDVTLNGVDEEDESGDYAPIIVGLSADQARTLQLEGYSIPGQGNSALEIDIASQLEQSGDESDEDGEGEMAPNKQEQGAPG